MKKIFFLAVSLILVFTMVGCGANDDSLGTYTKINPEEAKIIMEENQSAIILDVRTKEEFEQAHIKGAILIPDYDIASKVEETIPDKNSVILVYCRSGNRSKSAAKELSNLGYINVYDFGGIVSWPYDDIVTKNE